MSKQAYRHKGTDLQDTMSLLEQTDREKAEQLHDQAQELLDSAQFAAMRGETEEEGRLLRAAFEVAVQAASLLEMAKDQEPARSALYHSAATLALRLNRLEEAERLACFGLTGTPPTQVAEELRDLFERVNFRRHLRVKGVRLSKGQFQLSLNGPAVDYGVIESSLLVPRITWMQAMIQRTVDRMSGFGFDESSKERPRPYIPTYVCAFSPNSLLVTLQVGAPSELRLPGTEPEGVPASSDPDKVLDEVFRCLDLFRRHQFSELRAHLGHDDYYKNFVVLAKKLAADGDEIRQVGITVTRRSKEKSIALHEAPPMSAYFAESKPRTQKKPLEPGENVTVVGMLREAKGKRIDIPGVVEIVDDAGEGHRVHVDRALMRDIVRPYWDERVVVTAQRQKGQLWLQDISPEVVEKQAAPARRTRTAAPVQQVSLDFD